MIPQISGRSRETDAKAGHQIRTLLAEQGGIDTLAERCQTVAAWHSNNDLPLLWPIHANTRTLLFRLLELMDIHSATQDRSLLDALAVVVRHRHTRCDDLKETVDLGFASHRWQDQLRMPVRVLRQIISMLLVAAYLSATIFVTAPAASAAPSEMSGMTMQHGTNDQMPCKGLKTGCVMELGCVFMVSLPAPDLTITAAVDWSPVTYTVSSEFLDGRSTKPALGPPRSFT
jgi:hypothetical protein